VRLACLVHSAGPTIGATAEGVETWMDWLQRLPSRPIAAVIIADDSGSLELADLPEITVGCLPMSKRAFEFLGEHAFEFTGEIAIEGAEKFVLGYPFRTDSFLEMSGRRIADPMRLQHGVAPPHGKIFQSSRGMTGLQGTYFVTLETWYRIKEAKLTGLVKVGEYEVLEAS
jgi:hypothetical protein